MTPSADRWVLLVDDEEGALTTLADVLLDAGFLPRVADSLETAKAIIDSAPIGVIVVDLVLGDGTGVQLAEWLRQHHPQIPILFMSAYTDLGLVEEVLERREPFFPKPLDLPRLLGELHTRLRFQAAR